MSSSSFSANEIDNLRIPFEDVVSATNNFANENLIKQGETADVYKGILFRSEESIDVAVRRFRVRRDEFLKEIKTLSHVKHENIISIVGFCDENGENIMVMEYAVKGSLDQYISDPTTLGLSQRLKICLGVTRGFQRMTKCYPDYDTIYRDMTCSNILLDKDWEAKISCFGLPKYEYDDKWIGYSLGLIFLQLLYGRELSLLVDNDQFVAAIDKHKFLEEKVDELMDPTLRKQINPLSFTLFLQTAYDCRTAKYYYFTQGQTVVEIENALKLQLMHENIEKGMITHFKIRLNDIEAATESFSERYLIYSNSYEKLYKAELGPLERKCYAIVKEFDKKELFKRRIVVGIHCISYDKKRGAQWFFQAFKMLTSCKHPNIVSDLLGFNWVGSDMTLVFQYPLKGNLRDYLRSANIKTSLTWKQRVQISLDIAHGLNYIRNMEDKLSIKHIGITSSNVFFDDKWNAKIVNYSNAWRSSYQYDLIKEQFIHSFGVLLFEILFGQLADEANDLAEKGKALKQIPRSLLEEQTQWEMVAQDSLDAFSKIAYQCLNVAETQAKHRQMNFIIDETDQATHLTMEAIIKELEKALFYQISQPKHLKRLAWLKIPLSNIKLATRDFHETYIIGKGGYGNVYKTEVEVFDNNHSLDIDSINKYQLPRKKKTVAIKRIFVREDEHGKEGFLMELRVLTKCEHPNIVSLVGYCDEDSEMILIYELAANGSLDDYLRGTNNKSDFTWSQRIKLCLDIAYVIKYLHSTTVDKEPIIHRDIKSDNILLGDNWEAKIADFGLSKVYPTDQSMRTIITNNIAGTDPYMDPTYQRHRFLKKESDIYSFGVVLFEIISGKLAYDYTYRAKDTKGLAPIARNHFKLGTQKELIDPELMNEAHEVITTLNIAPNQDSLNTFLEIAHKCLAKTQDKRPTIDDIIQELQKALRYQEHRKDILKLSLEEIILGSENFSDKNCIITGGYWKVYSGEIQIDGRCMSVFIKRLGKSSKKDAFLNELGILYMYKHENVIGVVGYCEEKDEKIIVHEHASNRSLSMHLNNVSLGWIERLKICIDVAIGLQFLHENMVVHGDIKSSSILLNGDYKAKISDFGHSLSKNKEYVDDHFIGTPGYSEYPSNTEKGLSSKEYDMYSFGVVLFEILCGRLTLENYHAKHCYLDQFVKKKQYRRYKGRLVFQGINEQIAPESLDVFHNIAYGCLAPNRQSRPTAGEVVKQLHNALEIQEKWEELKLPDKDEKTIQLSESSSIDSKEIPLQDGKMWSDGGNGERTDEIVSAMEMSYLNHSSLRWQSIQDSRFQKVAEMLDTTNLMIGIETKTQFFSGDYGVYLVFKFRDLRKLSIEPLMYVNLEYKRGNETLHAYFATWRDDEWMMIELSRIFNHKEDAVHKFLLESFSPYYCGDDVIYVAGIEFRAFDNVKNEEIKRLQETHQVSVSDLSVNQGQQLRTSRDDKLSRSRNHDEGEKNMIWRSEVNGKKHLMLSAKEVLLGFPNEKLFTPKPSTQSSFEDEIELFPQQVFRINCTIKGQMLSKDTEYVCYLVFKLPEKCDGLQCPVKVQDLLHHGYKEAEIVYFISPNPWNIHAITRVPKQREDGWMEVIVWKFNFNDQLENDSIPVNLRLMSYEGSMAGLIICGIEFRPM